MTDSTHASIGTDTHDAPARPAAGRRPVIPLLILLALVPYMMMMNQFTGGYAGGSDSAGYLNSARLLGSGRLAMERRGVPGIDMRKFPEMAFVPLGFQPADNLKMRSSYPIGMSIAALTVAQVTGWPHAPHVTMLLFSLLGIVTTLWLARVCGLPWAWAWLPAALLAGGPLYLVMAVQFMSDVPSLVFVTAAMAMALQSRTRRPAAILAGMAVAAAVFIRPTNVLVILPVAVALGCSWRRWLLLCLGGAPGALVLVVFNHFAYGGLATTGYGDLSMFFSTANIPATLRNYREWIPMLLTPAGTLALGIPFLIRRSPRIALTLMACIAGYFGFFAIYAFTSQSWWFNRFVLPAFPACLTGAALVLRALTQTRPVTRARDGIAWLLDRKPHPAFLAAAWIAAFAWSVKLIQHYRYSDRWEIHFLLPLAPVLCLAVFRLVRHLLPGNPVSQLGVLCAIPLLAVTLRHDMLWNDHFDVQDGWRGEIVYSNVCDWANRNLPANAVIYANQISSSFIYYTSFPVVRHEHLDTAQRREIEGICRERHRPIYAVLLPYEAEEAKKWHFLDHWTPVPTVEMATCWKLNEPAQPGD